MNLKRLFGHINKDNAAQYSTMLLAVVLIFLNFKKGFHIVGLDNASPFFDIGVTLHRVFNSDNFFEYGGIIFTLPFTFLRMLSIPSWLISQLFVWGALLLGMYFYSKIFLPHLQNLGIKLLLPLILFANLVPIWIFSQPIYLFVASFVGIPAVIFFLQKKRFHWSEIVLLGIGFMYFFATSINPIAFILYLIQCLIVSSLLKNDTGYKTIFMRASVLFVLWILIVQLILTFSAYKTDFVSEFTSYININSQSELSQEVTESLRTAELKNNTLTNVLRYATGWLELNDVNNQDLFKYSRQYANNYLFAVLGLIPSIAIFIQLVSRKDWRKEQGKRILVYALFVLISTTYSLLIIGYFPYIRDGLRWVSSKTWPTLYIIGTVLFIESIQHIPKKYITTLYTLLAIILFIYAMPWWKTPIINDLTYVNIPKEYLQFPLLVSQDTLIVYPKPQKLFFRSYEWGYYGTDFLSYITKAHVVDGTSIHRPINEYAQAEKRPHYFITEDLSFTPSYCLERIIQENATFKLSYCEPIAQR